jgi:Flp pilus assembly pilin Flp
VITAVSTALARLAGLIAAYRDEDGQGLAEYALILGLIACVVIVSVLFMGHQVSDKLNIIGNAV